MTRLMERKSLLGFIRTCIRVAIEAAMHAAIIRADVTAGEAAALFAGWGGFNFLEGVGKEFVKQQRINTMCFFYAGNLF